MAEQISTCSIHGRNMPCGSCASLARLRAERRGAQPNSSRSPEQSRRAARPGLGERIRAFFGGPARNAFSIPASNALRSNAGWADAGGRFRKLNLNTAAEDELTSAGIRRNVAHNIVVVRPAGGFQGWDEVRAVPGVGDKTLTQIKRITRLGDAARLILVFTIIGLLIVVAGMAAATGLVRAPRLPAVELRIEREAPTPSPSPSPSPSPTVTLVPTLSPREQAQALLAKAEEEFAAGQRFSALQTLHQVEDANFGDDPQLRARAQTLMERIKVSYEGSFPLLNAARQLSEGAWWQAGIRQVVEAETGCTAGDVRLGEIDETQTRIGMYDLQGRFLKFNTFNLRGVPVAVTSAECEKGVTKEVVHALLCANIIPEVPKLKPVPTPAPGVVVATPTPTPTATPKAVIKVTKEVTPVPTGTPVPTATATPTSVPSPTPTALSPTPTPHLERDGKAGVKTSHHEGGGTYVGVGTASGWKKINGNLTAQGSTTFEVRAQACAGQQSDLVPVPLSDGDSVSVRWFWTPPCEPEPATPRPGDMNITPTPTIPPGEEPPPPGR